MPKKSSPFRLARILILLTILAITAISQWQTRSQTAKWDQSQWVVIYPINAGNNDETQTYLDNLHRGKFSPVEEYLNDQAHQYGVSLETPFIIELAPQIDTLPPAIPEAPHLLDIIWYSLKLRYYGFTNNSYDGPTPDIKIYVNYFAPIKNTTLDHSVGLEKGKIGIVNGFSSWKYVDLTNVIIAHEILHTVGATDKYDPTSNLPHYPEGYGDPNQQPLLPQTSAEIMGGSIIISETKLTLPKSLRQTTVGELTATEINWLEVGE